MRDSRQVLKAARRAQLIASSGDYDAESISRMFEQVDSEVEQLVRETTPLPDLGILAPENSDEAASTMQAIKNRIQDR
jgi:predicted transcriptional regulator